MNKRNKRKRRNKRKNKRNNNNPKNKPQTKMDIKYIAAIGGFLLLIISIVAVVGLKKSKADTPAQSPTNDNGSNNSTNTVGSGGSSDNASIIDGILDVITGGGNNGNNNNSNNGSSQGSGSGLDGQPAQLELALLLVKDFEGGYQKLPSDTGNYTYSGKLVGTNRGISAKAFQDFFGYEPTENDMRNLTQAQALSLIHI